MIIVNLIGGLGNQMFQYAFAKAYSLMNNVDFKLDINSFEEYKLHKYCLPFFNITENYASKEETKALQHKGLKWYYPKFIRKKIINSNTIQEEQATVFYPELLEKKEAYYLGYFQSEKYFKDYREVILKDFTLKVELNEKSKKMLEQIKSTNSVSLHVRRTDYINLQEVHGLCTLDYYKKAIDYIVSKTNNPHFYLFSDDIHWVIENLKINYPYTVIDFNNSDTNYCDLELMKNCKHNIIANSSFSWWGAWLNENPNKIVVAPKKWFADPNMNYQDIIPEGWIKC